MYKKRTKQSMKSILHIPLLIIRKIESLNLDNFHVEQQYAVDQMIKTWIFPDFYTMTTVVSAILKVHNDFVFHF